MTRLPELSQDSGASQDDAQVAEFEELLRGVPKLIGLLPAIARDPMDARQSIAVATMITGLTRQLDKAAPTSLVSRWRSWFLLLLSELASYHRNPNSYVACQLMRPRSCITHARLRILIS
jgi:hypothetical protein